MLPINMIEDIIVADALHLLELGVMKKLLNGWRTGCMSMKTKWSTFEKKEISKILVSVQFFSSSCRFLDAAQRICNG